MTIYKWLNTIFKNSKTGLQMNMSLFTLRKTDYENTNA